MKINKAIFIKGITGTDETLYDEVPQVAFIGRSNSGKSSTINALVNQNKLAITSSFPGRTRKLMFFQLMILCILLIFLDMVTLKFHPK